jgi:Chaperone of endosialidase
LKLTEKLPERVTCFLNPVRILPVLIFFMKYKNLLVPAIFAIAFGHLQAQNVGIGTNSPAASAQLQISSNNKGLLIPLVSLDSLKDVTSISAPANGLMVFNTKEPGARNDLARGFYYYSTTIGSWIRLTDNVNDNVWQNGGALGIQLRDKTDAVEIQDNFTAPATNYEPKLKILKIRDSVTLNTKNNIPVLTLTGVEKKTAAGWENRAKTSLIFENAYLLADGTTSATSSVGISSYTENTTPTANSLTNGLGFYTFSTPHDAAALDTPAMSMYRRNIGIGAYATDINNVNEGRLQITGSGNGDQLSLRHPSGITRKWGFYVSLLDTALFFYYNGAIRATIDPLTGVFTPISDRNRKKDILPMAPVLQTIMKLPAFSYQYTGSNRADRRMLGFMAQDIQPYFPELVYQRYDRETTKPFLTMDYSGLGVVAIKAIQEQQAIIESQQEQMSKQEEKINQLLKRIERLEEK